MRRRGIAVGTALAGLVVILIGVIALSASTARQPHEPYSQQYSKVAVVDDFSLGDGNQYYSQLKSGEENVLMFWGSWCPHCESLIEQIDQLEDGDMIRKNLFTVAEDESLNDIKRHQGDFPIYLDQDKRIYELYQLEHIPTVFILDDKGTVLGSAQGGEDSLKLLQEYAQYNR